MSTPETQKFGEVLFGDLPKKLRSNCKTIVKDLRGQNSLPEDFKLGIKSVVYSDYRPDFSGGYVAILSHPFGNPDSQRLEEIARENDAIYTPEEFEHTKWAVLKGLGEVTGRCPYKSTPAKPSNRFIYYKGLKCRLVKSSKKHNHAVEYLEGDRTGERDRAPITLCSESREESMRLWQGRPQEAVKRGFQKDSRFAEESMLDQEEVEEAFLEAERLPGGAEKDFFNAVEGGSEENDIYISPRPSYAN